VQKGDKRKRKNIYTQFRSRGGGGKKVDWLGKKTLREGCHFFGTGAKKETRLPDNLSFSKCPKKKRGTTPSIHQSKRMDGPDHIGEKGGGGKKEEKKEHDRSRRVRGRKGGGKANIFGQSN